MALFQIQQNTTIYTNIKCIATFKLKFTEKQYNTNSPRALNMRSPCK